MNESTLTQKFKAGGIHFLLSLVVISAYLAIVFLLWYPEPFATLEKVTDAARVVIGVDLVIGPLLTFLLYKKDKPGLRFDLTMVVLLQVSALSWGIHITYSQRPVYVAYAEQLFSVVAASDLQGQKPEDHGLSSSGWGDQKMVFVDLPKSPQEKLDLAMKHPNLYALVDRYRPFKAHLQEVLEGAVDMNDQIKEFPDMQATYEQWLKAHGGNDQPYAFIPIEGRKGLAFIVLDRHNGDMVDIYKG
ncbi:MAG: hypothetical protein D6698_15855 [Gammaproteobacteria bacterium]|nr:MAG: hypothetical protein D6698_15855 [Gammaproteobacteria bacterium]